MVVVAVILSSCFSILPSWLLVPGLCYSELMEDCTGYGVNPACWVCFLQSFRVYFLFWELHLQLLCACLLLSVFKKSLFQGLVLRNDLEFMMSVIQFISEVWLCMFVFVCVCWYTYHPCHLHVHEWRIWMLLPTQETLIHLSTKKRYTHTYMHTHTHTHTHRHSYRWSMSVWHPLFISPSYHPSQHASYFLFSRS